MYGATAGDAAHVAPSGDSLDQDPRRKSLGSRSPDHHAHSHKARFTRSVNKVVRIQNVTTSMGSSSRSRSREGAREGASPVPEAAHPAAVPEVEKKEEEELPKTWKDVSHDVTGVKNMLVEGKNVFIALVITTILALLAIASNQGAVIVFALSFVALLPLAMQLGDLTEMLSGWCAGDWGDILGFLPPGSRHAHPPRALNAR